MNVATSEYHKEDYTGDIQSILNIMEESENKNLNLSAPHTMETF